MDCKLNFKFIGEGNDHCIVSITSTEFVLRIKKVPANLKSQTVTKPFLYEQLKEKCRQDLIFLNKTAFSMFGPYLVKPGVLVQLTPVQMVNINNQIGYKRTKERLHKVINPYGVAILCPDASSKLMAPISWRSNYCNMCQTTDTNFFIKSNFTSLMQCSGAHSAKFILAKDSVKCSSTLDKQETNSLWNTKISNGQENETLSSSIGPETPRSPVSICIELKPKQGFLEAISDQEHICRFCLKQYVKCSDARHSRYCPLELFSGDRARMLSACHMLFDEPQNNLKVFKDGAVIDNVCEFRYLSSVIVEVLLHAPYNERCEAEGDRSIVSKASSEVGSESSKGAYPGSDSGHCSESDDSDNAAVIMLHSIARDTVLKNFERVGMGKVSTVDCASSLKVLRSKISSDSLISVSSLDEVSNCHLDSSFEDKFSLEDEELSSVSGLLLKPYTMLKKSFHDRISHGDEKNVCANAVPQILVSETKCDSLGSLLPRRSLLGIILSAQESALSVTQAKQSYDNLAAKFGEAKLLKMLKVSEEPYLESVTVEQCIQGWQKMQENCVPQQQDLRLECGTCQAKGAKKRLAEVDFNIPSKVEQYVSDAKIITSDSTVCSACAWNPNENLLCKKASLVNCNRVCSATLAKDSARRVSKTKPHICKDCASVRKNPVSNDVHKLLFDLQKFIRSLTFKDCSIIVVISGPFATTDELDKHYSGVSNGGLGECETVVSTKEGYYLCRATIIDLVSKQPSKVSHQFCSVVELRNVLQKLRDSSLPVPSCCVVETK